MSDDLDALRRAYAAILEEARGHVAARRDPNAPGLDGDQAEIDRAEQQALQQLARVVSVYRARARLTREAAPPPAAAPLRRRAQLRTRPTITGNMEVRRGGTAMLEWDPAAAVTEWEVRFSERPDPRRDYVVLETLTLPGSALISALTREGWDDRWERRASAS
jgi:hypothetical protein